MIKIKREECLLRPSQLVPSSKNFRIFGVINPAATRMKDGKIFLYVRVIEKLILSSDNTNYYSPRMNGKKKFRLTLDKFNKRKVSIATDLDFSFPNNTKRLTFISHFRKVILSEDGFKVESVEQLPTFYGIKEDGELGVEDPRITKLDEKYVMTYVALGRESNVSTSYAVSKDLKNWKREGIIFREQNKDVVVFPEKIKNNYLAINRPEGTFEFSSPHMILSESPDLKHWGASVKIELGKDGDWDAGRVGAGAPPIRTEKGWLLIYHGVIEKKRKRPVYAAGFALLDLKNPRKVIAKTSRPAIIPNNQYEKGDFEDKNVIFPTGMMLDSTGKDLLIFSGGGDINTTVKQVTLKDVMKSMERS